MALSKYWKEDLATWVRLAGVRAVKTFAQTAASLVPAGVCITEVGWPVVLGTAAHSGVLSLFTSVAGIPELDDGTSLPRVLKEGE